MELYQGGGVLTKASEKELDTTNKLAINSGGPKPNSLTIIDSPTPLESCEMDPSTPKNVLLSVQLLW